MRRVALAEVKDDLSRFLRLAESEEILITRHGKPAGGLIGFETEEDWVDYRLEHHPEFLRRVAEARKALERGTGSAAGGRAVIAAGRTSRLTERW
jgi:prevent-host-death family protein